MSAPDDRGLSDDMAALFADPLGFVRYAFAWGQGELADLPGPRAWQAAFLEEIGGQVAQHRFDGRRPVAPILMTTASGHGIGKSALTAWLILWILSTRPGAKGIVTANTADQLRTKTWAELGKWWRRSITRHWFDYAQTRGNLALVSREAPETWRCDALTCREEQSESFAGLHAADSTPFYIFDEASAVPDAIWNVAMGGLTDGEPMFFAFGNPTRNSGRFFETHHKLRHRWSRRQIDSREVEGTNHDLFAEWVSDFGEDSDFVRVRVRGRFPRSGSLQFIGFDLVEAAMSATPTMVAGAPLILGVDVARFGDDQSVLAYRRGRDARALPWEAYRGLDTMDLAGRVAAAIVTLKPDAVFIDEGGVGGGVVDRLRQLGHRVFGVNFAAKPGGGSLAQVGAAGERYANKRAEMWGALRAWLKAGGVLPDDTDLAAELTALEYGFTHDGAIRLERKEDMKRRGLASPDRADALALTFAQPVGPSRPRDPPPAAAVDRGEYDPFGPG